MSATSLDSNLLTSIAVELSASISSDTRRDSASASFSSRCAWSSAMRSSIAAAVSLIVSSWRVSRSLACRATAIARCEAPAISASWSCTGSATASAERLAAGLGERRDAVGDRRDDRLAGMVGRLLRRLAHPHQRLRSAAGPVSWTSRADAPSASPSRGAERRKLRLGLGDAVAGRGEQAHRAPRAAASGWPRSRSATSAASAAAAWRLRPTAPARARPRRCARPAPRPRPERREASSRNCAVTVGQRAGQLAGCGRSAPPMRPRHRRARRAVPARLRAARRATGEPARSARRRCAERRELAVDLAELRRQPSTRAWLAASCAASWPASVSILPRRPRRAARSVAWPASALARSNAARLCSTIASIAWPCASSPVRACSTDSAARAIAPSTAAFICAAAWSIRSAAAPALLSIRATCAPSRCAAPPTTSSASRPRARERREMASSAAACSCARGRLLHRFGGRARLLLGLRQIAEQHADIDPGAGGGGVERLRACGRASAVSPGEELGDPAEPVGRLVAERHQPRSLPRSAAARLSWSRAATMASTLSSAWLSRAHRRDRGGEALGLAPRAAAEQQPDQARAGSAAREIVAIRRDPGGQARRPARPVQAHSR